jgi:hypothetical protein
MGPKNLKEVLYSVVLKKTTQLCLGSKTIAYMENGRLGLIELVILCEVYHSVIQYFASWFPTVTIKTTHISVKLSHSWVMQEHQI